MQEDMKELPRADENVLYPDCTDGYMVHTFAKTHLNVSLKQCIYCIQIVCVCA